MNPRNLWSLSLLLGLAHAAFVPGGEPGKELAKDGVVATVTGRVMLDANRNGIVDDGDKGLADVLVTDGIQFVRTDAKGSFTLKFADDPLFPYKPSQVISVCWPTGTWPVGQRFFSRRADIKPMQSVDFLVREQKQQLPFTFAHGTDPHDSLGSARPFGDDLARMEGKVQFCLMTGDLGYADPEGAEKMFTSIRDNTLRFPIPMMHTCGNHDIVGIHSTRWADQDPIAGYGPYTKYLGPIRYSFDYAGVHFVALDWARILEDGKLMTGVYDTTIDWLEKDLKLQKPGTRTFVFMHHHFRHGDNKFWDVLSAHKVELLLAGHSHRNKEDVFGGVNWLTTQNMTGPYRLVTVHEKGNAVVNRCYAGSNASHTHSYSGKCKMILDQGAAKSKRSTHKDVVNREVDSAQAIEGFQAQRFEIDADIDSGTASKVGIRLGAGDAKTTLAIQCADDVLTMGNVQTAAVRGRGDKTYRVKIIAADGKIAVFVNNRVQFEQPFALKQAAPVELFAEGGRAVFNKVDVWELK